MPFIVPFLPAIIGAGGAIGSALINKSAAGQGAASNQANFQSFQDLLDQLSNRGGKTARFGRQDRRQFYQTIEPARDYWQNLLTGDRGKMEEFLAPELNQVNRAYAAPIKTIGEFGPRGGGTNSAISALQTQKAGDVSNLFFKARPAAAEHLAQIAPLFSSLSATEQGLGINAAEAASSQSLTSALGQMWADIERRRASGQAAGGLGSAIGQLIGVLLNRQKGGGSAGSNLPVGSANIGDIWKSIPTPMP